MFNFEKLDIQKDTNDTYNSFVGIKKSIDSNKMTFFLPKGFENFEVDYDNVKNLFFSMYKTFKRFEIDNISRFDKMLDKVGKNKDNTYSRDFKGYKFSDEENEVLFYSKIDIIDNFFKVHQELDIDSIVQRFGATENIDYSNIEVLLNEGIFLKNNAIFISENASEKNIIESHISDIVELYCYIYKELLIELNEEINPIISEIADNFSYKYLTSLQSLFDKDTYEMTVLILKDCLDNIDKHTAYKDYLYHNIYEVIEQFLYGQLSSDDNEGDFWGINNFSYIWEDMCNNFVLTDASKKILYCDTYMEDDIFYFIHKNIKKEKFKGQSFYKDKDFINNFYIEFDGFKRWLRPDLVVKKRDSIENYGNPLDIFINKKIIFIKKKTPNRLLNLGSNNINVDMSIKQFEEENEESTLARKIFSIFAEKFANLYRIKGITRGSLNGYRYTPKGKNSFSLTNIPEDKFNKIYQDIYDIGEANQSGNDNIVYLVDWKYVPYVFFNKESKKLRVDTIKQLTYEFCIMQSEIGEKRVVSQFCIPKYCSSDNLILEEDNTLILDSGIQVVILNFRYLQERYIDRKIKLY